LDLERLSYAVVYSVTYKPTLLHVKLRVVLDTNVWVSAFRSRQGASRKVIDMVIDDEVTMHVTVPLVAEYEEVFVRECAAMNLSRMEVDLLLDLICRLGQHQEVHYLWRWQVRDPEDTHVLEAVVAASCPYLLTFNKRDLEEAVHFGIEVLTPGEFLHVIRQRG